jgi:MFS family permease
MAHQQPSSFSQENKSRFFYGYIIILASFFIVLVSWGTQYSFGVFFKPVLNEFHWTRALTSGAYSLNLVLTGVFAILAGIVVDRFGPRLVITIGGCFLGLGYLLTSTVNSEWQYYLYYGLVLSIGLGCMVVPLLSTAARWFPKKPAITSGIVMSGIGLGIVVMPQVANKLISSFNWRTSFIILGIVAIILIVGLAQLLRHAPDQSLQTSPASKIKTGPSIQLQGISTEEALRTRQFWILFVFCLFVSMAIQTVMVHMVAHSTDIGYSAVTAATILSVIGLVSVIGKISMGGLADRIGNRKTIIIVSILIIVAFVWLRFASELWTLYLFAVVFAAGYSGFSATHSPLVAEYFGLRSHGTLFGIGSLAANGGGALGAFTAGYIFDTTGSYQWAFTLCALLGIICLILAILLKPVRKSAKSRVTAGSRA